MTIGINSAFPNWDFDSSKHSSPFPAHRRTFDHLWPIVEEKRIQRLDGKRPRWDTRYQIRPNQVLGVYAGYVSVNQRCPLYEKLHNHPIWKHINVHNDLSFSGYMQNYDGKRMNNRFWVGFTCNDVFDQARASLAHHPLPDWMVIPGTFRDVEFVRKECLSLARQINDLGQKLLEGEIGT